MTTRSLLAAPGTGGRAAGPGAREQLVPRRRPWCGGGPDVDGRSEPTTPAGRRRRGAGRARLTPLPVQNVPVRYEGGAGTPLPRPDSASRPVTIPRLSPRTPVHRGASRGLNGRGSSQRALPGRARRAAQGASDGDLARCGPGARSEPSQFYDDLATPGPAPVGRADQGAEHVAASRCGRSGGGAMALAGIGYDSPPARPVQAWRRRGASSPRSRGRPPGRGGTFFPVPGSAPRSGGRRAGYGLQPPAPSTPCSRTDPMSVPPWIAGGEAVVDTKPSSTGWRPSARDRPGCSLSRRANGREGSRCGRRGPHAGCSRSRTP